MISGEKSEKDLPSELPDADVDSRRDEILRRMLKTPPKVHGGTRDSTLKSAAAAGRSKATKTSP